MWCRGFKRQALYTSSGVTRALIGGGIFIYSCSARRISFEMNLISKEIRRAEHEYMNIHPPPNSGPFLRIFPWGGGAFFEKGPFSGFL